MTGMFQCLGDAVDADTGAKGIHISDAVSHDDDIVLARDDFFQRMRLDPGLHPCILFHLLGFSTVVGDACRGLDDRLVSSPPQRQIDGVSCKFEILRIGQTIHTDSRR